MKYLVMECHLSYAVVLDENGRFRKVANRHYQVGQTVTNVVIMNEPAPSDKRSLRRILYPLAAVAAVLMLFFTSVLDRFDEPYASLYISINPQVRIDVKKDDTVKALSALNEDGKRLIADYAFEGKPLESVTEELFARAIEMEFLTLGESFTLSFDSKDNAWIESHKTLLAEQLSSYLSSSFNATIAVDETSDTEYRFSILTAEQPVYSDSDYGKDAVDADNDDDDDDAAPESAPQSNTPPSTPVPAAPQPQAPPVSDDSDDDDAKAVNSADDVQEPVTVDDSSTDTGDDDSEYDD